MSFKVDDRVRVQFDRVGTIDFENRDGTFDVEFDDFSVEFLPASHMTPAEPVGWPPQLGDIWETDDNEFFVRAHRGNYPDHIFLEGAKSHHPSTFTSTNLDDFKALNPRLVRRRGQ